MPPTAETMSAVAPTTTSTTTDKLGEQSQIASGAGGATRNPNCDYVEDIDNDTYRREGITQWNLRMNQGWFTGLAPPDCPGFHEGALHALPQPNFETCTRESVLAYFNNGWTITEMLFEALLHDEAYTRPPWHQLRHPKAFYFCHPASLYINKLRVAGVLTEPLNAAYEQYFETGVDEMSWDDLSKNEMKWPSVADMREYRQNVYSVIKDVILTHPCLDDRSMDTPAWCVFLCFEHERIHIETSSVLIRELPIRMVRRPEHWPAYHESAYAAAVHPPTEATQPSNEMVPIERGTVVLGKPRDYPSFGWDATYGERTFNVPSFKASKFLVTNGEYWHFVNSRAYQDPAFWTQDGWQWRSFRNAKWPTYWVPYGPAGLGQYKLRTIFDVIDMPWSWPADVNMHEAEAYCNWRTAEDSPVFPYRLITEPEHNRLRQDQSTQSTKMGPEVDHALLASGSDFKAQKCKPGNYNLHMAYGSECPVDTFPATKMGCHDVFGNVWHWCKGWFCPLPGFKVHPVYDDFSAPCFDGAHAMILGGSFISIGEEASIYSRFHFRPHFFQHAGFRLGQSAEDVQQLVTTCTNCPGPFAGSWRGTSAGDAGSDGLRGDALDSATTLLHYGRGQDIAPVVGSLLDSTALEYPKRLGEIVREMAAKLKLDPAGRALDVGAGPGGVSFELARSFKDVTAIEMEAHVVETAKKMQLTGSLSISAADTVVETTPLTLTLDEKIERQRVAFTLMDACCMPLHLGEFEAVVCSEVLTYVQSPKSILGRMQGDHGLVKKGGLLVVASADEWSETTCARDAWLNGRELDEAFELLHTCELPYVLREHNRKFEVRAVKVSCYVRKA